ncbi:helix-turn-helix domain-containing protein [Mycobacterium sp.]|jgi:AcrR family transcriptional regulator|uniref:TetR/AcrR family transcriptional regulator n=1 Tax=Mycobacterium sp. TaxID=1785 RepID=UPI002C8CFCE2|nr:helix-turn-helix domain-containing protein [Mycobacterium sp.]HXB89471.1 helix-turn-helix domain-containing protein [Mycobacterium sp.]
MAQPARPLRADAARNRARVLAVACETFAAEGFSVPVEEIARRAGVGTGTVCRHFPTKQDLVEAVFADRLKLIVDEGQALLDSGEPDQALFGFLRLLVLDWGVTNHGLKKAFAGSEIRIKTEGAEDAFLAILGELLRAAQQAGTVRTDVGAAEVKGLIIGCQAMQTYSSELAERLVAVVFDGLRATPAEAR